MPHSILIVDDEPGIRQSLAGVFEDEGFDVTTVESGEQALREFEQRLHTCVLLDVWLPGIDGLETLERLKAAYPDISVVMISGHGNIETAVKATKLGAFDFVEKPLSLDKTVLVVKNAIKQRELEAVNTAMRAKLERDFMMVGDSVPMRALRQQISYAAPTNGRILIYGESGTGKELVARALHARSLRASHLFVEVNCAAIPEELIESELFGHVKGAFTGATQAKRGKFEQADDATLFLDEIGDMSLRTQSKVLRALEEQRFQAVGSETTISVDVRVIAATNKKLEAEIEKGAFRADLFYRLNVIPFEIPPLRERLEDIPLLVEHFNREFSQSNKREPKEFTPAAIERMQSYHWPGNVRELRNTVERVIIMRLDARIDAD
ncbi:MAG: sigma-54 dependent transcriptional regulator, partial [Blastocatellia bacterium]